LNYGDGKIIDEPASTVDEVISQLAASEIVVASRFHNVLLALWLNKPVLAISFHEKVDSLMEAVGLGEFRQDINDISVDRMTEQFRTLEDTAVAFKAQITEKAEAYRTALDHQYERIFGLR
jgi:polysaccharide pyruvyl transferase WcaK-like protein